MFLAVCCDENETCVSFSFTAKLEQVDISKAVVSKVVSKSEGCRPLPFS